MKRRTNQRQNNNDCPEGLTCQLEGIKRCDREKELQHVQVQSVDILGINF